MAHRCFACGDAVSDADGTYIVDAVDDGEIDFDFTSDTTEPEGCWEEKGGDAK